MWYKILSYEKNDQTNYFVETLYDGREEKYEVHNNFTQLYDLLLYLYSCIQDTNKTMKLRIRYENYTLSYYIESTSSIEGLNMCGCELQGTIYPNNTIQGDTLYYQGGLSSKILDKNKFSIVEQIITQHPDYNFEIQYTLENPTNNTDRKKKLKKDIEADKKKVSQTSTNIIGCSKEKYDIKEETDFRISATEYYATLRPLCHRTQICVTGNKQLQASFKNTIKLARKRVSYYTNTMWIQESKEYLEGRDAPNIPIDYIATLFAFPVNSVPGIKQIDKVNFGTGETENDGVCLGKLTSNNTSTLPISIDLNELTKHTFITGVTGSGKTNTIKHILNEATDKKVPFLVLEPAKNEYKNIGFVKTEKYQLGSKNSGLKLNPFYFPDNLHIQTHIDHIKSIFVAAFPMYGPMPYILETAIYNIYRNKGWDIVTSKTIREYDKYPTLEDLLYEIDEATELAGYSDDLQNDVKGALKVRINSLITGAKGNMLNCPESDNIDKIIEVPTVISLESVGDAQEKVFLMGLILISLYEYYIAKNEYSKNLKNILVFEEAHRLLENVQAINNPEIADMKGKALETFNNILSEIRAYGQGIIVADQIPSKISADVLKNTNLKIVHRLFAKDDRDSVGSSIGLNEKQINHLIHLKTGEAVVFHSQLDDAVKIQIPERKSEIIIEQSGTKEIIEYCLTDNPEFINECLKWLKTALLLEIDKAEFDNKLSLIARDFGTTQYDESMLWNKILRIFINETNLLKVCEQSYAKRLKRLDNIVEQPYVELMNLANDYINKCVNELNEPRAILTDLFIKDKRYVNTFLNNSNIIQDGVIALNSDEIINLSSCGRFLATYLLDDEHQKQKLADCIICTAYNDYPEICDRYFGTLDKTYISKRTLNKHTDDKIQFSQDNPYMKIINKQNEISEILNHDIEANLSTHSAIINFLNSNINKYLPLAILGLLELILIIVLLAK